MAIAIDSSLENVAWGKTLKEPVITYPKFDGDDIADVVVVGAGFFGLNAALHAATHGCKVILFEAGVVGNGASGRNGGFVVPHFPGVVSPSTVERTIGRRKARDLAELVLNGANWAFRQAENLQINCSAVRNGWVQPAHSERSMQKMRKVFLDWQAFGADISWHSGDDISEMLGARGYVAGWSNKSGGTINPYGLAIGLARVAAKLGVEIFQNSPVTSIEETKSGVIVSSGKGKVTATTVIFAVNAYAGDFLPSVQRSAVPVLMNQIITKPLRTELRETILKTEVCFSDLRKSGGFGRLDPDGRLVTGGAAFALAGKRWYGEKHARSRLHLLFPQLQESDLQFDGYWEGYCAITDSQLPHMQRLSSNVFSVSGFSGRGVNLAQNLGRIVGEFAAGVRSLDDVPIEVIEGRKDVSYWPIKVRGASIIFPFYQMKDRLSLT